MYIEFKEGQKFASRGADTSPMHESFNDAGWLLSDNEIVVDIDNLPKDTIKVMIDKFNIDTQVVWTTKGAHLYFDKPNGFKTKGVSNNALGVEMEYKDSKNSPNGITIKRDGILRDIDNAGKRQELPEFLRPLKQVESMLGLNDGDKTDNRMYSHKFKIMNLSNWRQIMRFINDHIIAYPFDENDFQRIAREEELRAEKDGEYHVGQQLLKMLKVVKYNERLYTYDGKRYRADQDFRKMVAEHLRGQKVRYIKEVIESMEMYADVVEESPKGFDVKFKNGILRDGQFYEIESSEFTPYYIDTDYNENADVVQAVEDYLDFLTDGDKDYRSLILECMAHTLITNSEFKRQLAKFFVFIGDGGNGKGTMLTIMRKILGNDNCSSLSPEEMTKEQYFTSLNGKLVNLGDDIEDKAINEKQMKVLKNISTCDFVSSRELFKQSKEVVMTTSLIFTSNHLLKSFEKGESYKRRVVWCPMFGKITKKDPHFITRLTTPEALEYWVKLMVEAYFRLYNKAEFTESNKVKQYNENYHRENNGCLEWLSFQDTEDIIGKRPPEVYEEYETWCEENGVNVQSKKILRETLETEFNIVVKAKSVNGKTAKVYMEKD